LVAPVSARSGAPILRVDEVEYTSHFTRVGVTVLNAGSSSVSLPVFGNCVFVGDDFRSPWSTATGRQQGTVVFAGALPPRHPRLPELQHRVRSG
jgi:hypothetical protein